MLVLKTSVWLVIKEPRIFNLAEIYLDFRGKFNISFDTCISNEIWPRAIQIKN